MCTITTSTGTAPDTRADCPVRASRSEDVSFVPPTPTTRLTSARSYRGALTPEATIDYLAAQSGALLDPNVFDVLATVVRRGRALVFIDDA